MDVIAMFETVLETPQLYLGIKSISRLQAFMSGYILVTRTIKPEIQVEQLWDFYRWVEVRYHNTTSFGWADLILFYSLHDEHKAFDTAKQFWEQYKAEVIEKHAST